MRTATITETKVTETKLEPFVQALLGASGITEEQARIASTKDTTYRVRVISNIVK